MSFPVATRKKWLDFEGVNLSMRQQTQLLGINRSSLYYKPTGESEYNLVLMNLLGEQYTKTPYYGIEKMVVYLDEKNHAVNVSY